MYARLSKFIYIAFLKQDSNDHIIALTRYKTWNTKMSCRFFTILLRQRFDVETFDGSHASVLPARFERDTKCTRVHQLRIEGARRIVSYQLLIVPVNPFRYSFEIHLLLVSEYSHHAKVKYLWATPTTIAKSWNISPIVSARFANLHDLQWHLLNVFITNPIFVHATHLHEWFTLYNSSKYYEEAQCQYCKVSHLLKCIVKHLKLIKGIKSVKKLIKTNSGNIYCYKFTLTVRTMKLKPDFLTSNCLSKPS